MNWAIEKFVKNEVFLGLNMLFFRELVNEGKKGKKGLSAERGYNCKINGLTLKKKRSKKIFPKNPAANL